MYCLIIFLLLVLDRKNCYSHNVKFSNEIHSSELPVSSRRIFHGVDAGADIDKYSFAARLWFKFKVPYPNRTAGHVCSGAIISKFWILSAAHCLYKDNSTSKDKRYGDISFRDSYANVGYVYFNQRVPKVNLDFAIVHPYFVANQLADDIMGVKTRNSLLDGRTTSLATLGQFHEVPSYGEKINFIGWGAIDLGNNNLASVLQIGEQHVETPSYCDTAVWGVGFNKTVGAETIICSADLHYNSSYLRDADSGGPMIWNGKLVGVASFFADNGGVAAFAKIAHYKDWIEDLMKGYITTPFKHPLPNVTISEFPYMARLSLFTERNDLRRPHTTCNGAVFTPHAILTAAHCLLKKNTLNLDFKLSESFATVGFDVFHQFLPEHKLQTYRIYPEYDPIDTEDDIAVVFTLTNLFKNDLVKPAALGTFLNQAYTHALVPAYNTIIESRTPGLFVNDNSGLRARYLQRGMFTIQRLQDCRVNLLLPALQQKEISNIKCLRYGSYYPFRSLAGSPLVQNGVVVGIVIYDYPEYAEVNMLSTEIGDWLYSVLWPQRVVLPPIPVSCRDRRAMLIRDKNNKLENVDHLWNMNWVVPVCKDESVNFQWNDTNHVVKITIVTDEGTNEVYTGVLIHHRIVLSAAHYLFEDKSLTLRGDILAVYVSTGSDAHQSDVTRFNVKYHRVHPEFDPLTQHADIMLLFLEWVAGPKTVDYAVLGTDRDIRNAKVVDFWGWGIKDRYHDYYNILRRLPYRIGLRQDCHDLIRRQRISWNDATKMCIFVKAKIASYKGDVGGPVLYNKMALVGVVSHYDAMNSGVLVVTKLPPFAGWIQSVINTTQSYLAKISLLTTDKHDYVHCTGAIIRDSWVLGAAVCAFGLSQQWGEILLTLSFIQVGQVDFSNHHIRNIIRHQQYKPKDPSHELCLYRTYDSLVTPKSFTRVITIVPPRVNYKDKVGFVYAWQYVSRNGNPKATEIKELKVTFSADTTECRNPGYDNRSDWHLNDGTSICAWINGRLTKNLNYGPVVFNNMLVGMVSWVDHDGSKLLANSVLADLGWIDSTIITGK